MTRALGNCGPAAGGGRTQNILTTIGLTRATRTDQVLHLTCFLAKKAKPKGNLCPQSGGHAAPRCCSPRAGEARSSAGFLLRRSLPQGPWGT